MKWKLFAHFLLPHYAERREMAFLKWQRSGYQDITAHDDFLIWRDKYMKLHAKAQESL